MTNAAAARVGPRRVETRLLVKTDGGVYGVTYRWDSPTNAVLVPTEGLDEAIPVLDASGVIRTQVWHYPSRSECVACHTPMGGYALGFNTAQLNREMSLGGVTTNQLRALSNAGYFETPVAHVAGLPELSSLSDERISREYRVRSYLAANCAQCHQPGGPAHAQWDARVTTPLAKTGIVNGTLYDLEGDATNRVVVPGDLAHSMLFSRIGQLGKNHMPPIGSGVLDSNAVELVRQWITIDVPSVRTFADWQLVIFGSTNLPAASLQADPDTDGASNEMEFLTGTNPQDVREYWRFALTRGDGSLQISFPQVPNVGFVVETTADLSAPAKWEPLDVPENRLQFLSTPQTTTVQDIFTGGPSRFYRVRIVGP